MWIQLDSATKENENEVRGVLPNTPNALARSTLRVQDNSNHCSLGSEQSGKGKATLGKPA